MHDLTVDRNSGVPLGTQLAWKLAALVRRGEVKPGDKLPSVRELARAAGVNVNTARAVYGRLESEGLLVSQQGRGTFVAASRAGGPDPSRRALREQITHLEAELAMRRPLPPAEPPQARRAPPAGGLLSNEELERVRDDLLARLQSLDTARQEILQQLDELKRDRPPAEEPARRSSPSLAGARVRWVGAH